MLAEVCMLDSHDEWDYNDESKIVTACGLKAKLKKADAGNEVEATGREDEGRDDGRRRGIGPRDHYEHEALLLKRP